MNEQEYLDFLIAWGEEFAGAMWEDARIEASSQDAYEVFVEAFGEKPTPQALASLSEQQLEKLRQTCEKCSITRRSPPLPCARPCRVRRPRGQSTKNDASSRVAAANGADCRPAPPRRIYPAIILRD
jgi:hypothetical protein